MKSSFKGCLKIFSLIIAISYLSIFCILGLNNFAFAENNSTEELAKPVILPNSPLYFLKDAGREVQYLFAFDPVKKAELRLDFANQKLVEIKKLAELDQNNTKAIDRAIKGYEKEVQKVKEATSVLKKDSPQSLKLLDKITNQIFAHQQILDNLAPIVDKSKIETAQTKSAQDLTITSYNLASPENIKNVIANNIIKSDNAVPTQIKKIEIINKISQAAPDELKKEIITLQDNLIAETMQSPSLTKDEQEQLNKYFQEIKSNPEYGEVVFNNLARQIINNNPDIIEKINKLPDSDKEKLINFSKNALNQPEIDFENLINQLNSLDISDQSKELIFELAKQALNNSTFNFLKNQNISNLPNPASAYCQEQGYKLEIRQDLKGNQYGVCVFDDKEECDEWKFYRGECGQEYKNKNSQVDSQSQKTTRDNVTNSLVKPNSELPKTTATPQVMPKKAK